MKKRWLVGCVAFMTAILAMTPAYGAGTRTFFDYIESSKQAAGPSSETATGPGSVTAEGETSQTVTIEEDVSALEGGPTIHNVSLSGTYHEDFDVYEIVMHDEYFLYSNVNNGAITDQPVYVEIPQGIVYSMELNGQPMTYQSGQKVSDHGTYVLRLTAVDDDTLPFYRQEEYQAIFRFRIQSKAVKPEETLGGFEGPGPQFLQGETDGSEEITEDSGMIPIDEIEESTEASTEVVAEPEDSEEEAPSEAEPIPEEPKDVAEPRMHWTQSYDGTDLLYHMEAEDGTAFTANVPEGMAVPGVVLLHIAEGDVFQLYRNDELVEYESGSEISEVGAYRLEINGHSWYFEIIGSYVNTSLYQAPKGMRITRAGFNDELMELTSEQYLPMEADGEYNLTLSGEAGDSFQFQLIRDTVAPEITVAIEDGKAYLTYSEQDLQTLTLSKNGTLLSGVSAALVEDPGDYIVTAVDQAGNANSASFHLDYALNGFALISIVLIIGLVAAGGILVAKMKRTLVV